MVWNVVALVAGLVLLMAGASGLVRGASALALRLGLSPLVVGLTVVAFGTSAPELVVSVGAAIEGAGGIAVGNVVGSNIANIGLILGVAALLRPFAIERGLVVRDLPAMVVVTLASGLLLLDRSVDRVEGLGLVVGLLVYLVWTVRAARREAALVPVELLVAPDGPAWRDALFVIGGLALLVAGAELLVTGAVALAEVAGVSNAVIGLTVVALGTSLPELATSIVAALRGESEIAVGNVVGSNLFNLLGILGVAALVRPMAAPGLALADVAVMTGAALVLVLLVLSGRKLIRAEGGVLLVGYLVYVGYLAVQHG